MAENIKARNYHIDDGLSRDWLKAVPVIREVMGTKEVIPAGGEYEAIVEMRFA